MTCMFVIQEDIRYDIRYLEKIMTCYLISDIRYIILLTDIITGTWWLKHWVAFYNSHF